MVDALTDVVQPMADHLLLEAVVHLVVMVVTAVAIAAQPLEDHRLRVAETVAQPSEGLLLQEADAHHLDEPHNAQADQQAPLQNAVLLAKNQIQKILGPKPGIFVTL